MSVAAKQPWPPALITAARLVSVAVICGLLFWGQVVLIPIALAALVTFLIGPLVSRLDRWGVPRILAVIVVTGSVTGAIGAAGYVAVGELAELAQELPQYRENIRSKIGDIRAMTRGGTIEDVQRTIAEISEDVERDAAAEAAERSEEQRDEPLRVAVEPERSLLSDSEFLDPVLQAAATAGLTMLLSIFMLIKREDLRNRLVSLAGQGSLAVTTRAFTEAGQRISRYLLMQFIINASMGLAVGVGLYFIGVPYSALWGLAAAVLRYIPYLGPWIAALLPISVSLVTAPGWEQVVFVIGLFVLLELFSNNVMEPWLYGQSVGLSPIAVIVAAIFWTWLWGPVGLVIATPITACLVVLSRFIPELGVFDRLLSERPALQPHLRLYQRLLARDEDEAEDVVEQHRQEHSLAETCDELLLGSLLALQRDLVESRVTPGDAEFVEASLRELGDEMIELAEAEGRLPSAAEDAARGRAAETAVLIGMPVHGSLDEMALQLLRTMLLEVDCELEILSPDILIGERIAEIEARAPAAVCLASLPGNLAATRHVCKRLHARLPDLPIVVGRLLTSRKVPKRSQDLLQAVGARHVVSTLEEMRDRLLRLTPRVAPTAATQESPSDPAVAAAG